MKRHIVLDRYCNVVESVGSTSPAPMMAALASAPAPVPPVETKIDFGPPKKPQYNPYGAVATYNGGCSGCGKNVSYG